MALPKVIYDAGAGLVMLQFVRSNRGFRCQAKAVAHDNEATSGGSDGRRRQALPSSVMTAETAAGHAVYGSGIVKSGVSTRCGYPAKSESIPGEWPDESHCQRSGRDREERRVTLIF
jgi:hypothetical protein